MFKLCLNIILHPKIINYFESYLHLPREYNIPNRWNKANLMWQDPCMPVGDIINEITIVRGVLEGGFEGGFTSTLIIP